MRRGLTPIIVVFVLHHVQHQMMRPYVPLYVASLDLGYIVVGITAAAIALVPMFVAVPVGSLVDRWGARPLVTLGAIFSASSYVVLWAFPTVGVIIASQLVAGLANVLVVLSAQAYVGSLGQGIVAERNFGTYTMFASIGQILGPLLGGVLIGVIDYSGAFLVAASLSAASLAAGLVLLPRRDPQPPPRERSVSLGRKTWHYLGERPTQLAILASSLMSIPEVLRTAFMPIYLGGTLGLDTVTVGYILALFSVAGLVSKAVLPRVTARTGRYVALLTMTVVCAATVAVLPFWPSLAVVATITTVMGLTFGLGRPLSMAMAANSARPEDIGVVVGLRIAANRIADFAFPLAFGTAAAVAGIAAPFVVGAVLMLVGAGAIVKPTLEEVRRRRDPDGPQPAI